MSDYKEVHAPDMDTACTRVAPDMHSTCTEIMHVCTILGAVRLGLDSSLEQHVSIAQLEKPQIQHFKSLTP